MCDHTMVQGATFDMRGQLYRRHANTMALFCSPVVNALGCESDDPGSSCSQDKFVWEKKNASSAFRLG